MRFKSNDSMASTTHSSTAARSPSKHFRGQGVHRAAAVTATITRTPSVHWLGILLALCVHTNYMSNSMIPLCYANPLPTSLIRPSSQSALLLGTTGDIDGERVSFDRGAAAAQTNRVGNLTRQHGGDVFYAFGEYICLIVFARQLYMHIYAHFQYAMAGHASTNGPVAQPMQMMPAGMNESA